MSNSNPPYKLVQFFENQQEYMDFALPGGSHVILSVKSVDAWLKTHPRMMLHDMLVLLTRYNAVMSQEGIEYGVTKKA